MRTMSGLGLYIAFLVPPLILGFAVQAWLKRTFTEQSQVPDQAGLTGAQVARMILDRNGLSSVPVKPSSGGDLSDHYDPRERAVYLSHPVHDGASVAALAVGAHEVGHAIQHQHAYAPLAIRSALFPAVSIASSAWTFVLLGGIILQALGLIQVAIALYAVVVVFQLVTLPVEFDASRRAGAQLRELGLVSGSESAGVRKVLSAAAMTYVAGALAAIAQLMYFVLAFLGDD
jgi:Zn-dependent membrane protease YugP